MQKKTTRKSSNRNTQSSKNSLIIFLLLLPILFILAFVVGYNSYKKSFQLTSKAENEMIQTPSIIPVTLKGQIIYDPGKARLSGFRIYSIKYKVTSQNNTEDYKSIDLQHYKVIVGLTETRLS